jgi:hypothetical protein
MEMLWQEEVMAKFKVISRRFSGSAEENHEERE